MKMIIRNQYVISQQPPRVVRSSKIVELDNFEKFIAVTSVHRSTASLLSKKLDWK